MIRKSSLVLAIVFVLYTLLVPFGQAEGGKVGYVDLRRAFYDYEKSKTFEEELNKITDTRQKEREKKVKVISKLRDEMELLSGDARKKKQSQVEAEIAELSEFDRDTRQQLLNKKNDMFREVIDDIQKVVEDLGKKGNYDYILDSRNIMYGKEEFDLTDEVLEKLNK